MRNSRFLSILFTGLAISPALVSASTAYNSRLADRYFFGLEFERQYLKPETSFSLGQGLSDVQTGFLKSWNNGYSAYLGYRFYDFGFRVGYTYSQNINYYPTLYSAQNGSVFATGYIQQKSDNVFLDAFYYYQFAPCTEFKFMLGVGALRTTFDSTLYGTHAGYYLTKSFEPGGRIGLGAQYQISSCLVADILFKYQVPANSYFKYISSYSIGLAWYM